MKEREESRKEEHVTREEQHLERLMQEVLQMLPAPLAGWPWPGLTGLQSLAIVEERHQSILRDMEQVKGKEEWAKEADLESHINPKAAAMGRQDDCVGGVDKDKVTNCLIRNEVWEDGCPTVDEKKLIKIFDPFDLLAPFTIKFRMLRQRYIKADLEWDEPLQGELAKEKTRLFHCRKFKIMSARERAEVVSDPEFKEPAGNSTSGAEAQRSAIFNEGRKNKAGKEEKAHRRVTSILSLVTRAEGIQVTD